MELMGFLACCYALLSWELYFMFTHLLSWVLYFMFTHLLTYLFGFLGALLFVFSLLISFISCFLISYVLISLFAYLRVLFVCLYSCHVPTKSEYWFDLIIKQFLKVNFREYLFLIGFCFKPIDVYLSSYLSIYLS